MLMSARTLQLHSSLLQTSQAGCLASGVIVQKLTVKSVYCSLGSTDRLLSSRAEILNKNRIKEELAEAG